MFMPAAVASCCCYTGQRNTQSNAGSSGPHAALHANHTMLPILDFVVTTRTEPLPHVRLQGTSTGEDCD
jgi:hypothetical protein